MSGAIGDVTTYPAKVESVRAARQWVRRVLARWGCGGPAADLVELLTSEVATNAVIHAGTPYQVTVTRADDRVRIAVHDGSHTLPESPAEEEDDYGSSGRGIRMLDRMANGWGVDPDADGKVVWFQVDWATASHWLSC